MTDPARVPAIELVAPPPSSSPPIEQECPDPDPLAAEEASLARGVTAVAGGVPAPGAGDAAANQAFAADGNGYGAGPDNGGCTQAQLRRFVKSRPYVPLHELRRRFGIGGQEDEVSAVAVDGRTLFVGLPDREAGLLGDLIRGGDIGFELLLDPDGPMIVGVWPMRPVQRS